ncbi:hypothetical protein [Streptomyces varsoviensis]|uniref:hypothetical protein n=1 Tax=Streptomyces varsoviensis TaxID=67373 RepID=UPI000B2D5A53|nr:hypothetical protein [Streptomyces varsoviensis]
MPEPEPPTPAELAAQARAMLREWSGYDPTEAEEAAADAELERRLAEAMNR